MPVRPKNVAQWLTAADRAGLIRLTPRTIVAVERLLRTKQYWDADELASRLASLLAEDGEGWQRIHRHCRDTLEFKAPGVMVVVRRSIRRRVPGWVWAALLACVVVAAAWFGPRGLTALRHWVAQAIMKDRSAPPVPEPLPTPTVPELLKTGTTEPEKPTRFVPPRPIVQVEQLTTAKLVPLAPTITFVDAPDDERLSSGWLALWIAISAALAGLAARWWWFAVADSQQLIEQAAASSEAQQDELMGQVARVRPIYFISPALPLPRGDIDEAATILARISAGEPGRELDVLPTLRRTLDAGGRFEPVFALSHGGERLLVLVDVETLDGHAFLDGVEQLLAAWARGGLRFDRYDFKGSPERLTAGKRNFTLDHLIQRHEGAPMLLFSRLLEAQDSELELTWMMRLQAWSRRAWIDLDPRGAEASDRRPILAEAEHTGLARFLFTREGLVACARGLAQSELRGGPARATDLPEAFEIHEALELWAACAACVPDPTWPQLAAVRLQIPALAEQLPDPRLLGRLLEWLHGRGWLEPGTERGQGKRLLLTEHGVEELRACLRRHDAGRPEAESLERMTRLLLLEQLRAADVGGDPYSALRQQLKLRFHLALLDEPQVEALLELADGAVDDELRRMLALECQVQAREGGQRWQRATYSRVTALVGSHGMSVAVLAPSTWSWGQVRVFLGASGLALTGWAAVWALGGLVPPQTRETAPQTLREPEYDRVTLEPPLRPDLVAIRGGKFMMGSTAAEHDRTIAEAIRAGVRAQEAERWYGGEIRHEAEVGDFELCRTEVTQGQWKAVMGVSELESRYCGDEFCADEKPMTDMSWVEAIEYLNRLTEKENARRSSDEQLSLCYDKRSGDLVTWDWACTGYRLPTEAEWEYAARAGSQTAYFFGDDSKKLCEHANVADQTAKAKFPDWITVECDDKVAGLAAVGSYGPNGWGLYDVHGNVLEWVWDWYGEYNPNPPLNYGGPPTGSVRVLRGGSFKGGSGDLRSANRCNPAVANSRTGLRCARGLTPQLIPVGE